MTPAEIRNKAHAYANEFDAYWKENHYIELKTEDYYFLVGIMRELAFAINEENEKKGE